MIKSIFLAIVLSVSAMPANAETRETTLDLLRALSNSRGDDSVHVLVNDSQGGPVRIGDELVYRFESTHAGYLTAIHVDMHGAATLLYPRVDVEEGRVGAGQPLVLPTVSDGFALAVQPPVGRDVVYAIVTDTPIHRKDLGLDSREVVVSFEPQQAPDFIRKLSAILDARSPGTIQIAHIEQQIDGRGEVQYRSADIVGFFGERTRSIRPAKLDLQITFKTDSDVLDTAAKRNVDEFARALGDAKLRDMRFKVSGHTDDRGSEAHNMGLSRRRADTVRKYLIEEGGIEAKRLEIEAYGEQIPLMREESEYARQMNRRVEFTPLR